MSNHKDEAGELDVLCKNHWLDIPYTSHSTNMSSCEYCKTSIISLIERERLEAQIEEAQAFAEAMEHSLYDSDLLVFKNERLAQLTAELAKKTKESKL